MNNNNEYKKRLEWGKHLFFEVGDNAESYKIFSELANNKDVPEPIKKEAKEFISRIKIDPAAWLLLLFGIGGILIEILLIPTK